MKLKSNRDYWNELIGRHEHYLRHRITILMSYKKHMDFTGQEPKLEMFVNLLEKPKMVDAKGFLLSHEDNLKFYEEDCKKYQQAEDKKLFKGWKIVLRQDGFKYIYHDKIGCVFGFNIPNQKWILLKYKTLEDFVGCELTDNGIKQVGYDRR